MLSFIRDRLKTWVTVTLVVLVAIPLVFLGVGDYGTNQEQYAFKVNDQEVSRSTVLQEMGQFKEVLRKNYQGSIPPVYTDKFIKKITLDNLIRRNIENNISSNIGLVLSDESIIDDIRSTSSFRDENGFSSQLYKKRLFMINMNPEIYEQYIYQKGIREQLRSSITETSLLSLDDKKININANYHLKDGRLFILRASDINYSMDLSLDDINNYYETHKESFKSNEAAQFNYIRITKNSFINSIAVSEDDLRKKYNVGLSSGLYKIAPSYEVNHLVFPIIDDRNSAIVNAEKAYKEIISNVSIKKISSKYPVSDDTKKNNGYLGKLSIEELPDVIRLNMSEMKKGESKLITSESNAIHIFQLIDYYTDGTKSFNEVKDGIEAQLASQKGSEKYFATLDSIKEKVYSENITLKEISQTYNIKYFRTPKIDRTYNDDNLSSNVINKLFATKSKQNLYPPIYVSNDDVLIIEMENYFPSSQLSLSDSEEAIRALLQTQKRVNTINELAKKKLKLLNSGKNTNYEKFSVYKYDKTYNDEIMKIIHNQPITSEFVSYKLESSDYLFLKVDQINSGLIDKKRIDSDNFLDYLRNTQSESDYNSFYVSKYNTFEIDINQNYIDQ